MNLKACKYIFSGIIAIVSLCLVSSCSALHSSMHNVQVCFYGRVIDQNANPIHDVKIGAGVRHWYEPDILTLAYGAKEICITARTDKDGRFKLHGASGDVLGLEYVQKDGYELEPGQRSFGAVSGSFENPVVFKLWSTNIHEQLITGGQSFRIEPDGRSYVIDLAKGKIAESGDGDLKIWIKYPTQVIRGQLYDWSCEIDAINGGLLEETLGTAMYVAPTEGYTPTFQLQQQIKGGQSGSIGTRRFYVRLKSGQEYGRITVEMDAPYNDQVPGRIRVQYAINPSGSRILR